RRAVGRAGRGRAGADRVNAARFDIDLLVLGGGAAGLTAALVAAARGARVGLATKGPLEISSSAWAQGGIAAAVSADDSPALHQRDTLAVGGELCSPDA